VRGSDLSAAFFIFLLVTLAAIPSVVPLLMIEDPHVALRVSNAIQVALLFIGGYRWGAYTDIRPWKVGFSIAILGAGMCVLAVFLGG
jgi:VIT1/CCC1 family predicted Fe2+/Mn2+ transporter